MVFVVCTSHKALEVALLPCKFGKKLNYLFRPLSLCCCNVWHGWLTSHYCWLFHHFIRISWSDIFNSKFANHFTYTPNDFSYTQVILITFVLHNIQLFIITISWIPILAIGWNQDQTHFLVLHGKIWWWKVGWKFQNEQHFVV